jgi:hypothetical protein
LEISFKTLSATTGYLRFSPRRLAVTSTWLLRPDLIELLVVLELKIVAGFLGVLRAWKNRTYLWLHLTFNIIEESPSE